MPAGVDVEPNASGVGHAVRCRRHRLRSLCQRFSGADVVNTAWTSTDPRSHSGKTCMSAPLANSRLKADNVVKTNPMPSIQGRLAFLSGQIVR